MSENRVGRLTKQQMVAILSPDDGVYTCEISCAAGAIYILRCYHREISSPFCANSRKMSCRSTLLSPGGVRHGVEQSHQRSRYQTYKYAGLVQDNSGRLAPKK